MKIHWVFRILLLIFCGSLVFFGCGCGDDDDDDDDDAWTDSSSGLTWQDPPSSDYMTWEEAKIYCDNLSFDGHDDWRLPTISELRSLIRGCDETVTGGTCGVTDGCRDSTCWNDPCYGCDSYAGTGFGWPPELSPFGVVWYWSSSVVTDFGDYAWYVIFGFGSVGYDFSGEYNGARCVR